MWIRVVTSWEIRSSWFSVYSINQSDAAQQHVHDEQNPCTDILWGGTFYGFIKKLIVSAQTDRMCVPCIDLI